MANFNDLLPAAPAGAINVKWQADGSANISAYYSKSEAQTPWVGDVDGNGHTLSGAASVGVKALNATSGAFLDLVASTGVRRWAVGLSVDDDTFTLARCDGLGVAVERTIEANRSTGMVTVRQLTIAPGVLNMSGGSIQGANFDAASMMAAQTPWQVNIDANQKTLFNVPIIGMKSDTPYIQVASAAGLNTYKIDINSTRLAIFRYDNSGVQSGTPVQVVRATGNVLFGAMASVGLFQNMAWNIDHDGTNYRYRSAGVGLIAQAGTVATAVYAFAAGSAGAVASPVEILDLYSNKAAFLVPITIPSAAPASAAAAGAAGQMAWDSGFLYVCTATNTWKRVAIATW